MKHHRSLFATGIVPRLRFVFLAITFVLTAGLLIGFSQVRSLNKSVNELAVSSVSVFVRAEETERRLKNLLLVLRRVEDVDHLYELDPLERRATSELSRIRSDTSVLSQADSSQDVVQSMIKALDDIEAGASKILDTRMATLVHEQNLENMVDAVGLRHEATRAILEGMSYNAAAATDREFDVRRRRDDIELDQIEMLYHRNLILANTITEISLGLESVIDTAVGLKSDLSLEEIKQIEGTLRFKIRNIALLSGQLPENGERVALASEISKMRHLLFFEDGIFHQAVQLREESNALEHHSAEQSGPIEDISALSSTLTAAARDRLEQATQDLEQTTGRIITALSIANLLSLATIAAALVIVVEMQINRRMARLTEAVLAIADGQTDYKVDVTGQDELGRIAKALEVFKLNADGLHRSNVELERFAYVAAHDLRSPLRAIQDLAEWTLEDEENKFSKEGRENMTLLQSRIDRLNRLLSDLLEYSRVGKEEADVRKVSLESVVRDTAEMLSPNEEFKITHKGSCDTTTTYATPLRQILLNLISNAIKHHDRSEGRITVETHLIDGRLHCTVTDDGPGIDPKYHAKIFGLFQTLRPRDDVEGSGLGLAIIQKLLDRYDGSISVKSDPARRRGTKFYFDLPITTEEPLALKQAA